MLPAVFGKNHRGPAFNDSQSRREPPSPSIELREFFIFATILLYCFYLII